MKKISLICCLLILTCGCCACSESESQPINLPESYTVDALIIQGESEYSATFKRIAQSQWVVTFSADLWEHIRLLFAKSIIGLSPLPIPVG